MSKYNRREFLLAATAGAISTAFPTICVIAAEPCSVQHPLMPPQTNFSGQCPNCGMLRSMWARTWFTFENSEGISQACSFHCLAEIALKSGEDPLHVMAALYLNPKLMTAAEKAYFVVGSTAKGTMTMKSKIALGSRAEAEKFSKSCGGEVIEYQKTLSVAKAGLARENPMLLKKRLKKGVIVEPVDIKDQCTVCGMYPARYPRHKCLITTLKKEKYHFCSTQCLFEFLAHTQKYVPSPMEPFRIWVVDFPSGNWIGGKTSYYVVGSGMQGPMGHEAFAFDKKKEAGNFARQEGGKVLTYAKVTLGSIKLNPQ